MKILQENENYIKEYYNEITLKLYKFILSYYNVYTKDSYVKSKTIEEALGLNLKEVKKIIEELSWDRLMFMKKIKGEAGWRFRVGEKEHNFQEKYQSL